MTLRWLMMAGVLYASVLPLAGSAVAATPTDQGLVYLDSKGMLYAYPVTPEQKKSYVLVSKMLSSKTSTLPFTVQIDGSVRIPLDSRYDQTMTISRSSDGTLKKDCGDPGHDAPSAAVSLAPKARDSATTPPLR